MDSVLEILSKYNVTPLQLICMITYSIECHIDDIREGEYLALTFYPADSEKMMEELNVLSYQL